MHLRLVIIVSCVLVVCECEHILDSASGSGDLSSTAARDGRSNAVYANETQYVFHQNSIPPDSPNVSQNPQSQAVEGGDSVKPVKEEDWEKWVAPEFFRKNYPYYLAGYDEEDRPVWVAEFGKFRMRKVLDRGEQAKAIMEKYIEQAYYRIFKSIRDKNEELNGENEVSHVVFLIDFDGLELYRIAHLPTMAYLFSIARGHRHQLNEVAGATIIINANYVAEVLVNTLRPMLGRTFENTVIYGTNKDKWIPQLRRLIPAKYIPPWYGGSKDFTPIASYG